MFMLKRYSNKAFTWSGNVFQIVAIDQKAQNLPKPKDLDLGFQKLSSAQGEHGIDLFRVLHWRYGLTDLIGKHAKKNKDRIVETALAQQSKKPRFYMLSGAGGAGKTRLAAEAARILKEQHDWAAGFCDIKNSMHYQIGNPKGLLLIIDYPEEQPELVQRFCKAISQCEEIFPILVLLLTRKKPHEWIRDNGLLETINQEDYFTQQSLESEEASQLMQQAIKRYAECFYTEPILLLEDNKQEWFKLHSDHRLPLYVAAAAIEAIISKDSSLKNKGSEVLLELAKRERKRIDLFAKELDFDSKEVLARLLALATIAGKLEQTQLEMLAEQSGFTGQFEWRKFKDSSWWQDAAVQRLQPDRFAAAFVHNVFFNSSQPQGDVHLHEWLHAALVDNTSYLCVALSRLHYDLLVFIDKGTHPLNEVLKKMVTQFPKIAQGLDKLAYGDPSILNMGLAEVVIKALLQQQNLSQGDKATLLNNLSNILSKVGKPEEALKAAQRAETIHRKLVKIQPDIFMPQLEMSLNTLANRLSGVGENDAALKAVQESVNISRELVKIDSNSFMPKLAMSLVNLAPILSALDHREDALKTAKEAVYVYRELVKSRPDFFMLNLATSLNNWAVSLLELGHREDALKAAKEAAEMYRKLVVMQPEMLVTDLSRSLMIQSHCLWEMDMRTESFAHITEAVRILKAPFLALPQMYLGWVDAVVSNYLGRAEDLKVEPDIELVGEIRKQLKAHLSPQGNG